MEWSTFARISVPGAHYFMQFFHFFFLIGGELDDLWMVEVERVLGFPDHYTDVANLPPRDRLAILAMSGSVPLFRHILAPLRRYYAHTGSST